MRAVASRERSRLLASPLKSFVSAAAPSSPVLLLLTVLALPFEVGAQTAHKLPPKIGISIIGSSDVEEGETLQFKIDRNGMLSSPLKNIAIAFLQIGPYGLDQKGRPIKYFKVEDFGYRCSVFPPDDQTHRCFTIPAGEASIKVNVPTYATVSFEADSKIGFFIRGGKHQYPGLNHYRYGSVADSQLYATVRDGQDVTPDVSVTLSIPDNSAAEGMGDDTAELHLALTGGHFSKWSRGLVADESLKVPLLFSGGKPGTDFVLSLSGSPDGVSFDAGASTVTFTGPATGASAAAATLTLTALDDADVDDATVDVSIPRSDDWGTRRLIASGIAGTVKGRRIGDGQITLSDDDKVTAIPQTLPSKATGLSAVAGNGEVSL
ncbi:MAG: hypothetical protein F4158_06310, partial [Synechococcus sp. SB0675_bin_7]|nr:hypothetical protein [Synechococcus sp. SB0675_bin_7]